MSNIKDNTSDQFIPNFNDLLTIYCNDRLDWKPTKKQLAFLKDCYKVNAIGKRLVSRFDFPSFSQEKFRNLTHKLSFCFDKVIDSRPPYFVLSGINIENQTIKDTEHGKIKQDFEQELLRLKTQPPFIHDIKLQVKTSNLYDKLVANGITPHKTNKGITMNELPLNSNVTAGFTVYPSGSLLIHLGCTFHPIPYSHRGWLEVNSICSKVEILLQGLTNDVFYCPPTPDWLVTHYHFNKDGVIIDSPIHHYSVARLSEHSQIYTKKLENGKLALRYEEKVSPHKTVEELTSDSIDQEEYSATFEKANELYD